MAQPRGLKRHADDTLPNEQRLSKRFNLLSLDTNTRSNPHIPHPPNPTAPAPKPQNDFMPLAPTPHRIFIHDLDAEFASASPSPSPSSSPSPSGEDEAKDRDFVFLPEIERRLRGLPRAVLPRSLAPSAALDGPGDKQLVLYEVPRSLTVPEGGDVVRRAILEARRRAGERIGGRGKRGGGLEGEMGRNGAESGGFGGDEAAAETREMTDGARWDEGWVGGRRISGLGSADFEPTGWRSDSVWPPSLAEMDQMDDALLDEDEGGDGDDMELG